MTALAVGLLGFLLCFVFDLLDSRGVKRAFAAFIAGGALIAAAAYLVCRGRIAGAFSGRPALACIGGLGAVCSLAALVYALFFALPAREAYASGARREAVSSGIYGVCRHPGVWAFSALFMFLHLLCPSWLSLAAWLFFTALDIAYSAAQDRWIFPRVLDGYAKYKSSVPFLLPRR